MYTMSETTKRSNSHSHIRENWMFLMTVAWIPNKVHNEAGASRLDH